MSKIWMFHTHQSLSWIAFMNKQLLATESEMIFFNADSLTDTVIMGYEDYIAVEQPVVVEIGKVPTL